MPPRGAVGKPVTTGRRSVPRVRALVVEQGWSRGALAAVRALAAAAWTVGVAAPQAGGLAWSSLAARHRHLVRGVADGVDGFVASVAGVVRRGGYDVVFGAGEAELLALSAGRDQLPAVFPHAPHDVVLRAVDKASLAEAAVGVGLGVPEVIGADDVPDEHTPVVVKARLHARPDVVGAPPRIDTTVVVGRTAVLARTQEIREVGGDPQVQRFHTGTLVAYSAVRAHDGVVAESLQQAARIWPTGAGASCRATTLPVGPSVTGPTGELARRSAALLDALGWFGLAELQYLVGADGVPRLIDLNGRFYGSLSLAVRAGANLPAAWADLAVGRRTAAVVRARAGVRYQWGTADVRRALAERRGGLLADLAGTAAYGVGAGHSVADVRDPWPAVARLRDALGS